MESIGSAIDDICMETSGEETFQEELQKNRNGTMEEIDDKPEIAMIMSFGGIPLQLGHSVHFQLIYGANVLDKNHVPRFCPSVDESELESRKFTKIGGPVEVIETNFKIVDEWLGRFQNSATMSRIIPIAAMTNEEVTLKQWAQTFSSIRGDVTGTLREVELFNKAVVDHDESTNSLKKSVRTQEDRLEDLFELLTKVHDSMDRKHVREMLPLSGLHSHFGNLYGKLTHVNEMLGSCAGMLLQLSHQAVDSDKYRVMHLEFKKALDNCLADESVPDECKNSDKTVLNAFPPKWKEAQDRAYKKNRNAIFRNEVPRVGEPPAKRVRNFRDDYDEEDDVETSELYRASVRMLPPVPIEYAIREGHVTDVNNEVEDLRRKIAMLENAPQVVRSASNNSYTGPVGLSYEEMFHERNTNADPGIVHHVASNDFGKLPHVSRGTYGYAHGRNQRGRGSTRGRGHRGREQNNPGY